MIYDFSTFGSCSSRNIFNSNINPGYKNFFKINPSVEGVSLLSLMSTPIEYDETLIDSNHEYDNICVNHDLSKKYLDYLKKSNLDYLIFDTFFDVTNSSLLLSNGSFITDTPRLRKTSFYKTIETKEVFNLRLDLNRYLNFWRESCNDFFDFMDMYCGDIKVILNCARSVPRYLKDGKIHYDPFLKDRNIAEHNKYRDLLDTYILKNFDIEVLPFNYSLIVDADHFFGLAPTHFERRYYSEKTWQLNEIIKRNENINYNQKDSKYLRFLNRKKILHDFKINDQISLLNEEFMPENNKLDECFIDNHETDDNIKSLYKYITARIDIKNEGLINNEVKVLDISDATAKIEIPEWFKNKFGIGTQIMSKKRYLLVKIKCINDGELKISFKGIDIRNANNQRIPIYIKYTNFTLNNEKILKEPVITWHDDPYVFKKEVKDSEILRFVVEWDAI